MVFNFFFFLILSLKVIKERVKTSKSGSFFKEIFFHKKCSNKQALNFSTIQQTENAKYLSQYLSQKIQDITYVI